MKQKAIIVDIDGTLANIDHRLHLIKGDKINWKEFFSSENIAKDEANLWCSEIIATMFNHEYKIIFVTGRMEKHLKDTKNWISYNVSFYESEYKIFSRKNDDYRPDFEIKKEIYLNEIEPHYNVLFCVDDRRQVVDMWRSLGLVCLQCADGNY